VTVSADLAHMPFRMAVRKLFAGTGQSYVVDRALPDVVVDLSIRNVSLDDASRMLAAKGALQIPEITFARFDDLYVFHTQPTLDGVHLTFERGQVQMVAENAHTWIRIPMFHQDVKMVMAALMGVPVDKLETDGLLLYPPHDHGGGGGGYGSYAAPQYNSGGGLRPVPQRQGGQ
jgi:hypothetical protein